MKYIFIVILFFSTSNLIWGQELVESNVALEILEVQQSKFISELNTTNNITAFDKDIKEIYFNAMPIYLKEGIDVAASLAVCLEKALENFPDNQEDVVVHHDAITLWFIKD
jgi:hypothetical protein